MLGHLLENLFVTSQPTRPLVTVCILLLDLVVTLVKSYLVLVFTVKDTPL